MSPSYPVWALWIISSVKSAQQNSSWWSSSEWISSFVNQLCVSPIVNQELRISMNQLSESTKLKSSGWINWVNPMRKFSVKISSVNSSVNQLSKSTQWISSVNQLSESIQWRRSYWFTDLMIHWAIDSLNYWFTELLNHWATDLLSYWFTELLIHQADSLSCLFSISTHRGPTGKAHVPKPDKIPITWCFTSAAATAFYLAKSR